MIKIGLFANLGATQNNNSLAENRGKQAGAIVRVRRGRNSFTIFEFKLKVS